MGDRFIIDVVPATVAEIMGDKKVNLQTDIYVNPDAGAVRTRAAGSNIPEYAAKYVDERNVVHPAVVHLTDPYGYDKGYHTQDDRPSASQTRAAASGEYQYMTAEEMAGGKTRWGVKKHLLAFHNELKKDFKLAAKGSKDSVYVKFGSEVDFELNYFLTLEGGVKWAGILPSPYLEKFETGVDGHFDLLLPPVGGQRLRQEFHRHDAEHHQDAEGDQQLRRREGPRHDHQDAADRLPQ